MTRRKISLQDVGEIKADQSLDNFVRELGNSDPGFTPTDQAIYEVDLNRIKPDPGQPRSFLPHDLKRKLIAEEATPAEVMTELTDRADKGDQLALLILGGRPDLLEEDDAEDEDKGLLALARSIKDVGLRQPINLYSITNSDIPGERFYRIGEGERRYWAHQLLVLQGHQEAAGIRAIIEPLPGDERVVQRRQQAENAARQDLSAIARARSIEQIQDRLRIELGTRVPNETTIKLPGQRELDEAVGQEVKVFTGRAIGGRMVRNYLRLLKMSPAMQDLAEAAQLTEKQLRPVLRLGTDSDQLQLISQIINEKLSGRAVLSRVNPVPPAITLKRVTQTTIEQRLEKRLFQTATTVHEFMALGEDAYAGMIHELSSRMDDRALREALFALRRMIDSLVGPVEKAENQEDESGSLPES